MCQADDTNTPFRERARDILTRAKQAGVTDKAFATAYVALAEGESGYVFLTTRPSDNLPDAAAPFEGTSIVKGAVCCGSVIGIENQQDMAPILAQSPLLNEWLVARGLIQATDDGRIVPANGLGNPNRHQLNMAAFEAAMKFREKQSLRLFSLGPTQRHQRYFQSGQCGWADTWEQLWDEYVAGAEVTIPVDMATAPAAAVELIMQQRLAFQFLVNGRYLIHKKDGGCVPDTVPYPDGSPSSTTWLQFHAGNSAMADALYYGSPILGDRRPYRDVWAEVNAIAATVY